MQADRQADIKNQQLTLTVLRTLAGQGLYFYCPVTYKKCENLEYYFMISILLNKAQIWIEISCSVRRTIYYHWPDP